MAAKRSIHQDPEYDDIRPEIQEKRIKLLEDNVRKETKKKIEGIIKSNFEEEIINKDAELDAIDELLHEGHAMLDRLRACIITKYYATLGQEQVSNDCSSNSIHPAVKQYLGKTPKYAYMNSFYGSSYNNENSSNEAQPLEDTSSTLNNITLNNISDGAEDGNSSLSLSSDDVSSRGPRFKTKCKIVIGNVSKFIPAAQREEHDQSTHKWMIYVRGDKHNPNIESFVKKVRFLLHPSYSPTDIVEMSHAPFHLIKRGWGEFPVRVQLHFHDARNKPVDVIHNLKLDKTFTGLQTLNAETVVELHLFKSEENINYAKNSGSIAISHIHKVSSNENKNNFVQNADTGILQNHLTVNGLDENSVDTSSENFKLPITETENVKSCNSEVTSLNVKNSAPSDSLTNQNNPPIPKIIISASSVKNTVPNDVSKNSNLPNGMSAAFVKCTDSEGRVLLVPQSSLLRIKSEKPAAPKLNNVTTSINNASQIKQQCNISQTKQNATVPSYILKVVPNKESGQNQVLLIPMTEKKVQNSEIDVQIKNELISPTENLPEKDSLDLKPGKIARKRSSLYKELEFIKLENYKTFEELLKRVCSFYPIVKEGIDRSIFPHCAASLEEFQAWNIGKQRASEWKRAGALRNAITNLLNKKSSAHITVEHVWSRATIMTWCRKNGFVPMISEKMTLLPEPKWSGIELCSLTNTDDFVSTLKEEADSQQTMSDEEDIEVVEIIEKKTDIEKSSTCPSAACHLPHLSESAVYVKKVASQVGIDIKPIEIEPRLCVPVIEEMILSATKELVMDIIGSAVNEGFERLGGKFCPEEITTSDVYSAIKKIPKFDFLNNSYLGIPKESKEET